jgi:cell division septal protein FtsQ
VDSRAVVINIIVVIIVVVVVVVVMIPPALGASPMVAVWIHNNPIPASE